MNCTFLTNHARVLLCVAHDLPLPEPAGRERTVGEVLALLTGTDVTAI